MSIVWGIELGEACSDFTSQSLAFGHVVIPCRGPYISHDGVSFCDMALVYFVIGALGASTRGILYLRKSANNSVCPPIHLPYLGRGIVTAEIFPINFLFVQFYRFWGVVFKSSPIRVMIGNRV